MRRLRFKLPSLTVPVIGGFCCRFDMPDLRGQRFSAETSFGPAWRRVPGLFNHGMPLADNLERFSAEALGLARIECRREGLWVRLPLTVADVAFRDALVDLTREGVLGWSMGGMLTKKDADGRVLRWFLTEVTLAPAVVQPDARAILL